MSGVTDCSPLQHGLLVPRGARLDLCSNEIAALTMERGEFS